MSRPRLCSGYFLPGLTSASSGKTSHSALPSLAAKVLASSLAKERFASRVCVTSALSFAVFTTQSITISDKRHQNAAAPSGGEGVGGGGGGRAFLAGGDVGFVPQGNRAASSFAKKEVAGAGAM